MTEHVLLIGAGFVGLPAAERLAGTGRRVTAVRRSTVDHVPVGVDLLTADVHTEEGLATLPGEADVVVVALPPDGRDVGGYRRTYLDAPRRILAHLGTPPRLILLTTSTAVYATDDGSWVGEDDVTEPPTATSEVLRDGEVALAALVTGGRVGQACALRLGGIYGPGRTRLVDQVAAGDASCQEDRWTNRIHRLDAAAAIAHLVGLNEPLPSVLNVVDDRPAPQCEVVSWLARKLGAPDPEVLPAEAEPDGRRTVTNKRVSNQRLRALGFAPQHPDFRSGYLDLLAARS